MPTYFFILPYMNVYCSAFYTPIHMNHYLQRHSFLSSDDSRIFRQLEPKVGQVRNDRVRTNKSKNINS
ncbi:hypothetical protein HanPI659440_Chr05g0213631 [Helianthus annuus]|nr:hypothetical protein HanPI659440_Chr05g0213631 [Helianthus annuus]